jgi:hypothetical protein
MSSRPHALHQDRRHFGNVDVESAEDAKAALKELALWCASRRRHAPRRSVRRFATRQVSIALRSTRPPTASASNADLWRCVVAGAVRLPSVFRLQFLMCGGCKSNAVGVRWNDPMQRCTRRVCLDLEVTAELAKAFCHAGNSQP